VAKITVCRVTSEDGGMNSRWHGIITFRSVLASSEGLSEAMVNTNISIEEVDSAPTSVQEVPTSINYLPEELLD
jgi:hypothetical protein